MKAVFDEARFSIRLASARGSPIIVTAMARGYSNYVERCQDADIIFTNKIKISAEAISNLPKLKLIQLTATGMNNVDSDACDKHGVTLYNVAGYAVKSVPEHTFMLMTMAMRAAIHYHQQVIDGSWSDDGGFCLLDVPLIDLEDKTLGIIGVGTHGKQWSRYPRLAAHQGQHHQTPRNETIPLMKCWPAPMSSFTLIWTNTPLIKTFLQKCAAFDSQYAAVLSIIALTNAVNNEQILGYASDVLKLSLSSRCLA